MAKVNASNKLKFKSIQEIRSTADKIRLDSHEPVKYVMSLDSERNVEQTRLLRIYRKYNLLDKAILHKNKGEEEDAYIYIMKLLNILSYITKSNDYKKDKKYFTAMIGSDFDKAVELAEVLHSSLQSKYKAAIPLVEDNTSGVRASEISQKSETFETSTGVVTVAELYKYSNYDKKDFLLIDTRTEREFEESRMLFNSLINVPGDIIIEGASANVVEQNIPDNSLTLWRRRHIFELLILFDLESGPDSSAVKLKNILMNWDTVQYKNEIMILKGGYREWCNNYVWLVTNPLGPQNKTFSLPTIDLSTVNYPSFDVNHDSAKLYFDRSKKPGRPVIDRSKKPAAEQKYAVSELLREKELETQAAKEVEKDRLEKERQMQETMRKQKEVVEPEAKKKIENEGTDTLLALEELKNESRAKDQTIRDLEEQIQKMKLDSERSQGDVVKEQVIEEKIRQQEIEAETLKQEREALEKSQELERKQMEEALQLKLKEEARIRELEKIKDTRPVVNRATKPREKYRDFNPTPGPVEPGLTGLKNLGNTCYMNSILQCISNNSTLAKYFCELHYREDINRNNRTRGEVAEEMAAVVQALWSGQFRSVACKDFKQTVGSLKSEYKSYEQQDSHEFLTFLMEWLHNDLKKGCTAREYGEVKSEAEKAWVTFKMRNESLISTLFYGLQKSTVTCSRCGEKSATYEPFSNLSLIIPESEYTTLKACLDLYLKTEHISGWRCPKCKEERDAMKRTELCRLPSILVIHLKRFSFLDVHSRKRTTFVEFPLEDLGLQCNQQVTNYSLYGVSNHYGTMEGGHYTAYCKSSILKKWYKYDDHEVLELAPSSVKTNAAYILFYNTSAGRC